MDRYYVEALEDGEHYAFSVTPGDEVRGGSAVDIGGPFPRVEAYDKVTAEWVMRAAMDESHILKNGLMWRVVDEATAKAIEEAETGKV